jgi:Ni/Co efflux regulator RcnB
VLHREFPTLIKGFVMKKIVLAIAAAAAALSAIAPAQAYEHHHHQVCHKVHVHHHWERHCR